MFLHSIDDAARDAAAMVPTKLLIKKQRAGARGRVELMFSPQFCTFSEKESEVAAA
jgi:replicative DNA helicase